MIKIRINVENVYDKYKGFHPSYKRYCKKSEVLDKKIDKLILKKANLVAKLGKESGLF